MINNLEDFSLRKVCRLIEPGPVIMITTNHKGKANVMTLGFHTMMQHYSPTLIGVVLGPWDHSFEAIQETGECVIAIPGVDLAERVVDIGNCSGAEVDKFKRFNFTALPAREVAAPLIAECLANIECKVVDRQLVASYNFFILEAVQAWVNPLHPEQRTFHHKGDGTFAVDGELLNLQHRMVMWRQFQD